MINVSELEGRIFYRVTGDNYEYYDLDRLLYSHPECREFVQRHRFELEREYLQKKESSF